MWRQPALTVVATTLPTPDMKKNALRTKASAILSVRIAPGQTGEELGKLIEAELMRDPPGGVKVTLDSKGWDGESWLYEPKGPAFEAADRAYQKVWGRKLLRIGVGGSIPFVALFGRKYGDLPLILNGVMDPKTTAHGPNESMHLGIFRKAIAANVELYAELGGLKEDGALSTAVKKAGATATNKLACTIPSPTLPDQNAVFWCVGMNGSRYQWVVKKRITGGQAKRLDRICLDESSGETITRFRLVDCAAGDPPCCAVGSFTSKWGPNSKKQRVFIKGTPWLEITQEQDPDSVVCNQLTDCC